MIDLTPLDVRKKKGDFTRALRGYEPAAVDNFLDLAAERMEELVRENATLRDRVAHLNETLGGFRQREQAMNDALISAQQLREELRTQAAREAELALREARTEAERVVAEAKREAGDVGESMRRMQAARARYLRSFRAFVERQLEEIQLEEERSDRQAPKGDPDTAHSPPAGTEG